jgi:thioredoxin 1
MDCGKLNNIFSEWCGPCNMIGPIVEEVASEFINLKVVKTNADEAQDLIRQFAIRGIPTLLLFKDGKVTATKVGALSLAQLLDFISTNI